MAVTNLSQYTAFTRYVDSAVSIWGQECTVFVPSNVKMFGYENQGKAVESLTGVADVANKFTRFQVKAFIDFKGVSKRMMYHFNWFPADSDDLVPCFMSTNSQVREESYIRTATQSQVSVWGDNIFKVVRCEDDGMYKSLKRTYFLRPVSDRQLAELLSWEA